MRLMTIRAASLRRSRGFSLVEVIVAMFVLTIGIAALIPALSFNIKSNQRAKSYGIANYLAEKHIEKILSWSPYENQDGVYGIESDNSELFGSFPNQMTPGANNVFQLSAELFHNGYSGSTGCNGIRFASSGGYFAVDEGELLTGAVNQDDCASGSYRGEDFKIVRVTVSWDDRFGGHSIERQAYVTKN